MEQEEVIQKKAIFVKEVQSVSQEFKSTMEECHELIKRYNRLLAVTQQIISEVERLGGYQSTVGTTSTTAQWETYFQKTREMVQICQMLGEAVAKKTSPDVLIGQYLLGAKQEAAQILAAAQKQVETVSPDDQPLKELKEELSQKNNQQVTMATQLEAAKKELDGLNHRFESYKKENQVVSEPLTDSQQYADKVRQDADRYSRQRKLIADDQVILAKKEIDEYVEKRKNDLHLIEQKLAEKTVKLQKKFEGQVSGAMDSIVVYAQSATDQI